MHGLLLGEGEAGDGLARLEAAGRGPTRDLGHRVARRVGPAQRHRAPRPTGRSARRPTPRSRAASPTIRSRTSAGSRIAETRAAISRRVRSASARRAFSSRDRSSSSMSRRVGDRDGGLAGQAREHGRVLLVERVAPVGVDRDGAEDLAALESGAAMTEWIPPLRTKASRSGVCAKRSSAR